MSSPIADEVHARLNYARLNRAWAKAEIFLGLLAAGAGLFLGLPAAARSEVVWELIAAGLALFVLGGYLALAGHRSHLYMASTDRLVLLVEEIRKLNPKDHPS